MGTQRGPPLLPWAPARAAAGPVGLSVLLSPVIAERRPPGHESKGPTHLVLILLRAARHSAPGCPGQVTHPTFQNISPKLSHTTPFQIPSVCTVRLRHYSQSALASLTSKDLRSSTNLKHNLVTKEESLYCVAFGDPGHQKWIVVEAPLSIPVMLHVLNSVLAHRSPTFLAPATGAPMRI